MRHARLSPCGDHFETRFVSSERPSRPGPRHSGQSDAAGAAIAAATIKPANAARRATVGNSAGYMTRLRDPFMGRLRRARRRDWWKKCYPRTGLAERALITNARIPA